MSNIDREIGPRGISAYCEWQERNQARAAVVRWYGGDQWSKRDLHRMYAAQGRNVFTGEYVREALRRTEHLFGNPAHHMDFRNTVTRTREQANATIRQETAEYAAWIKKQQYPR